MPTRAVDLLEAPKVNTRTTTGRVVPEVSEFMLRGFSTAGASASLAEPTSAWEKYLTDSRALEFSFNRAPPDYTVTNFAVEDWPVWSGPDITTPESPEAGNTFTFTAPFVAPVATRELLAGILVAAELVNVQTVFAGSTGYATTLPRLMSVNMDALVTHRTQRHQVSRSREAALGEIRRRLDQKRALYAVRSPGDVVIELADDLGVGQLSMARAVGVTPTAVRKWRRGEHARAEHRARLSQFAAFFRVLTDAGLHDPAGWIDIPISVESTLTPLELFEHGRADLVVLLAAGLSDPRETLDAFAPEWRAIYAPDREYEVVTLADGSRSVVPRQEPLID